MILKSFIQMISTKTKGFEMELGVKANVMYLSFLSKAARKKGKK